MPIFETQDETNTIDPPRRNSGSAFCTVKNVPRALIPEGLVEVLGCGLRERHRLDEASAGDDDVDAASLCFHGGPQTIEVSQLSDVSLNRGYVLAN